MSQNFITMKDICKEVALRYGVDAAALRGPSRKKQLASARHVAMFLCYTLIPRASYHAVANHFNRDHSTVIYAVKKIADLVPESPYTARVVGSITSSMAVLNAGRKYDRFAKETEE